MTEYFITLRGKEWKNSGILEADADAVLTFLSDCDYATAEEISNQIGEPTDTTTIQLLGLLVRFGLVSRREV